MKKLLLTALFYLFVSNLFAQSISNRSGAMLTAQDARLSALYNLFIPKYADTTAANANKGLDSAGALIFTYDVNSVWYRQINPKKWVLFSNGNAPVYTADRGVKILPSNIIRLTDTVEGAGTKIQYLEGKNGAFRVGTVNGTQWDIANIGLYSFATGVNTIASGSLSIAMGTSSQATNIGSIAMGGVAIASGANSLALGNTVTASGQYSTALGGFQTTASGIVSMATGNFTKAVGNNSFSGGVGTYTNVLNGFVVGAYNDTTGASTFNPSTQVATDPIFTIGNGSGVGVRSNAFQMLRNGATRFSSGITATTDTTTFKPMVMDASGNVRKTSTWGIGNANIYNSDGVITGGVSRTVHGNGKSLTIDSLSYFFLDAHSTFQANNFSSYKIVAEFDDGEAGHTFRHASNNGEDTSVFIFSNQAYLKPYGGAYYFINMPVSITPTTDSLITIASDGTVSKINQDRIGANVYGKNLTTNTTQVGNIGAGQDDLMTYTLPANTLVNDGDYLEFKMVFFFGANANLKEVGLWFGGSDFYHTSSENENGGSLVLTGTIVRTSAATQLISIEQMGSNGSLFTTYSEYAGASEDLTSAVIIKATAIGVVNNDIVQIIMTEKYYPVN